MKYRGPVACIVALLAVLLCSCVENGSSIGLVDEALSLKSPVETQPNQYKIALVMKTLTNPFFISMEKGARQAESDFHVKLIVKTGAQETSIAQQIQIVEELTLQKVDAIVIAPGSSTELVQVLKKAQDAGIKIVNIDNRLDAAECKRLHLNNVPFISVKNDEGAYQAAKAIAGDISVSSQAVIIEGIRAAENAQLRKQGAENAFKENGNIRIVAIESANWKIDEAHDLAQRLFSEHPGVKLVFCANDMMAMGVVQFLKEAGIRDVLVSGFDNLDDVRQEILDGWITATIDQQPDVQGYQGVEAAVRLIRGEPVEPETFIPVKLITKNELR